MGRLILENNVLIGISEFYVWRGEFEKKDAAFILKKDSITGCKEVLKYDTLYENSRYDIKILTTGEESVSICKAFHARKLSASARSIIKEFIYEIISGDIKRTEIRFNC